MTTSAVLGNTAWTQALAFLVGKKRYSPANIAGHSLVSVLACAILMVILLMAIPPQAFISLFPELTNVHLWIVVFITTSTLTLGALTGTLLGLNRIPLLTSITVFKAVVALLLQMILLGALSLGLRGALIELSVSALLGLLLAWVVFVRKTGVNLRVQAPLLKEVLVYGGKSYPGHLGVMLLSRVDIYFVALFGGAAAAGLYAVAKGLAEIVSIIETSIGRAVIPGVITGNTDAATAIVSRSFRASFWLSGVVLLVGGLAARWLIPFIYGLEYAGAVPAFLLLSPGVLFLTTRTLGNFFSMQLGRPEITTYYVLASGLVSLPLSYVLTRHFGYLGAAAAFSLVASVRGVAAMVLFGVYSGTRLKDLLLISKSDLLSFSSTIRAKLNICLSHERGI
jgi:O-antigen/teichoic acid export membrane protein